MDGFLGPHIAQRDLSTDVGIDVTFTGGVRLLVKRPASQKAR